VACSPLVRLPKPLAKGFSSIHGAVVRVTGGRVATRFRGQPIILLTTTGRKTGREHTWPLVGLPIGDGRDGWVVAGSNGGHDEHPGWYLNLQAQPDAVVGAGGRQQPVHGRDATAAERAVHWARFVDVLDTYGEYQEATDRVIPVVMLEPVARNGTRTG
jgi:F420H(2)-dependent quinone reductase